MLPAKRRLALQFSALALPEPHDFKDLLEMACILRPRMRLRLLLRFLSRDQ
jgi:hypothetical protein